MPDNGWLRSAKGAKGGLPIFSTYPVIMISALSDIDGVARCIEMEAETISPKPFNATLLKARVASCLAKKLAHDQKLSLYEQLQSNMARLQKVEKLRDALTQMIVHDLRTPLTSIISGMQPLNMVGELSADKQAMMDIAVAGGTTLLGMINDLLDVEKLEAGSMQLEYTWPHLRRWCQRRFFK